MADELEERREVGIRVLHNTLHTSRKILARPCMRCFEPIDSGTEYYSYAALVCGEFYWHYEHLHCY